MEKEKVNQLNIDYFIERVNHYFFDVFHMYEFELEICCDDNSSAKSTTLWYPIEEGAGQITIAYANEWLNDEDTTLEEIDKTAFHEVCEALLWELQALCHGRFIMEKDIPNAVHRVIRRLENTIFNSIKDERK